MNYLGCRDYHCLLFFPSSYFCSYIFLLIFPLNLRHRVPTCMYIKTQTDIGMSFTMINGIFFDTNDTREYLEMD